MESLETRPPNKPHRLLLIAGALAIGVILVYSPVLGPHVAFVRWDDGIVVVNNPHIRGLTRANVKWMFTDAQWTLRYMPLSWLNWAIRYEIFGMSPQAFHAGGVMLHAANSVLLFLLIRSILPRFDSLKLLSEGLRDFASAAGAAIWAFHPLRVETAAWVTHEQFALASFFALLGALSYVHADGLASAKYWLSVLFISLAALAHPIVMSLPAILLVADLYPLRRQTEIRPPLRRLSALTLEKIPMAVAPLFVGVMTLLARAAPTRGIWPAPPTFKEFDIVHRVMQAAYVWAYYVWRPFVPLHLSPVYTELLDFKPFEMRFVLHAALLVLLAVASISFRRRVLGLLALFVCHLLILVPVTGFAEHPHWTNDRYSYLQAMIIAVACAWLIAFLWMRAANIRQIIRLGVIVTIACLAILSYQLAFIWHDPIALFEHILTELAGHSYSTKIYWRLGEAYLLEQHYADAARYTDLTLNREPDMLSALIVKGVAEIKLKNTSAAIETLRHAVDVDPNDSTARNDLAIAFAAAGQLDDAEREFRTSIQFAPTVAEPHIGLADVQFRKGELIAARAELTEALRIDPKQERARRRLAEIESQQR